MCEVKVNMSLGTHKNSKRGGTVSFFIYAERERERERGGGARDLCQQKCQFLSGIWSQGTRIFACLLHYCT